MFKQTLQIVLIIILANCFEGVASDASSRFIGTHAKGWHWYEAMPVEDEQKEDEKKPEQISSEPSKQHQKKTPSEVVASYRKQLENLLAKAWIEPTPQNILNYQRMQKDLVDRSKVFSDVWMETVFLNPSLDNTIANPVNQKARHIQLDLEKKQTVDTIKNLSQEYGLFFFFSSNCEFCHQFAPIVKQFSEKYGWEVLPITLDGGSLEGFPNAQRDNGLFAQWNTEVLPALFAVNPNTGHVIPIAFGLTGIDQMEIRIMKLVGEN
jgi:conjugal transfer pilus assembly protein TraF